jgi:ribose 5-phosphate isomerase B
MSDTPRPRIAIAADHGGFELKETLKAAFADLYDWLDLGTHSAASCNYADFGHAAAQAVLDGKAEKAVVICGSGIGISIAANRHPGIRAALCTDATMARLSRQHNDANVLALGARITGPAVAQDCVKMFMSAGYEGGRHDERVKKIEIED